MILKNFVLSDSVEFKPQLACLSCKDREEVHLTPNERKLLELIIAGNGKKEIIIDEIWHRKGTIVGESSYHQLIKMLRKKLLKAGLPSTTIKTIPCYGITLILSSPEPFLISTTNMIMRTNEPSTEGLNFFEQTDQESRQPCQLDTIKIKSTGNAVISDIDSDTFIKVSQEILLKKRLVYLAFFSSFIFIIIFCNDFFIQPKLFPYTLKVDRVVFHLSSLLNVDRQLLDTLKNSSEQNVHHIYIASDGHYILVAKCVSELVKDSICDYMKFF